MKYLLRILSAGVVLACLFFIVSEVRSLRRQPDSVRLVDTGQDLMELLRQRAAEVEESGGLAATSATSSARGVMAVDPSAKPWVPLQRTPIGPERTARLYASLAQQIDNPRPRSVYDPQAYFVHAPGWTGTMRWAEHPWKGWRLGYSQAGFRNPYEPADPPPRMRVILCGDSHLEGVVPYEETVPALLERGLRWKLGSHSVEVLNGATGGYDFYNYVGYLERSLALRPDVFVLVIFGGNDFVGLLPIHAYFERKVLDMPRGDWHERLMAAYKRSLGATAQGLHQVALFAERPKAAEFALDAAVRALCDMSALAEQHGIALVCAYLPPQHDVRPQDMREELESIRQIFGLSEDDLGLTDRLADRLLAEMDEHGLPIIDLRPILRRVKQRVYWKADHHLNTFGSYIVARELLPHLSAHIPDEH